MDSMLDFDVLNETIGYDPNEKDFKEFCSNLNSLGLITNPRLYLEVMENHNKSFIDTMTPSIPFKQTGKSVKDMHKAYNDVTSGGGTLIRAVWDMSMKALQLSTKIIKFILLNLAKVVKMIIGLAQTIGRIPENVKNKIRGNISLYITVNDVNTLHKVLIPVIDNFLDSSFEVSKGNMWGTFFSRRPIGNGAVTKYVLTENDMSYYRKMKSAYEKLKLIEFKGTVVKLENQNIVDIYFGSTKSIRYKDVNGNTILSTFYDALVAIFKEFQPHDAFLKKVQADIGEKLDRSQMNQSFARLSESAQKIVGETIQMIPKGINIIGNLIRYVMTDIKTLRNSADKILKRDGISKVKNESVYFGESAFSNIVEKRKKKTIDTINKLFNSLSRKKCNFTKINPEDEKNISPDGNDMELMKNVISEFNELTKRKSVKITTSKPSNPLKRTQSKFGGIPYWPKNKPYPTYTHKGKSEPYVMIAQINIDEVPKGLKDFPTKGILQFFVDKNVTYDQDCKVVYHDAVLSDDKLLQEIPITSSDDLVDEFPFKGELELSMELEEVYMNVNDYRFSETFIPIFNKHFKTDAAGGVWKINNNRIEDLIYKTYGYWGSRMDGYPSFTQGDPRYHKTDKDILLLQIDSDKNVMWGDCGICNFFINDKDLKNKKFDNVQWSWDCY